MSLNGPKSLNDIIPASKGVKIKNKSKIKKDVNIKPPIIKKNVMPVPQGELSTPPTDEALKTVIKNSKIQDKLVDAMKNINQLMNVRILPENKSIKHKENEMNAVTELVKCAMEIEEISPGEGIIAISTLAVRQGFSLRDAGNRLAYQISKMENKLLEIEKQLKGNNE